MRLDAQVVPATYRFVLELTNDEFTELYDDFTTYLELINESGSGTSQTFTEVYDILTGVE